MILRIHHAQVSIPKGGEAAARDFYCTFLGFEEIEKPESLRARGGLWARVGSTQVHFGVEDGVDRRATRAHLAYEVSDLEELRARLVARGVATQDGDPIPGMKRFEFRDPFENRVEALQRTDLGEIEKPLGLKTGWNRLSTTYLFEGAWHKIRQDKIDLNGRPTTYTWVEHPGAVFVVPVTSRGEVVCIRTYRYTNDEWCWELPAGGIGDKIHLPLEEVAREEMEEEAGCEGGTIESLGSYFSANGVLDLKVHYFLARDVVVTGQSKPEALETISEARAIPFKEALEWALNGKMNDGDSAFALLLAARRLGL